MCASYFNIPSVSGHDDLFSNNTCVLENYGAVYGFANGCNATHANATMQLRMGSNTVYTPDGAAIFSCQGVHFTVAEWAATGVDLGTVEVKGLPGAAELIAMGRRLLRF